MYFKNFLSYKESSIIDIEKKLVIVGPNGSGKSNIIRHFQLIKQLDPYRSVYWNDFPYWDKSKDCRTFCRFQMENDKIELIRNLILLQLLSMDNLSNTDATFIHEFFRARLDNQFFATFIDFYFYSDLKYPDTLNFVFVIPITEHYSLVFLSKFSDNVILTSTYKENYIDDYLNGIFPYNIDFEYKSKFGEYKIDGQIATIDSILNDLFTQEKIELRVRGIKFNNTNSFQETKEVSIKIKDLLKDYNIQTENSQTTIIRVLLKILQSQISILSEDRGLLSSISKNDYSRGLKQIIRELLRKKLSPNYEDQKSFLRIKKHFSELMKFEFDVILNYSKINEYSEPLLLYETKKEYPYQNEEYRLQLKHKDEDLIAYEPNLMFYEKNGTLNYPLNGAPGGAYEVIMVLATLEHTVATTIFLDEPGKTLHPNLLNNLREIAFYKYSNKNLIYSTHSPPLIGKDDLKNIIRCQKDEIGSNIVDLNELFNQEELRNNIGQRNKLENFFDNPSIKSMFFTDSVCFVEGKIDERFLYALFQIQEKLGYTFNSEIVVLNSKDEFTKAVKVTKFFKSKWIVIADFDAWKSDKDELIIESRLGNVIKENGLVDINKYSFFKKLDPYDKEIRKEIHSFERKNKIFTWKAQKGKGELEDVVKETNSSFIKKYWKTMSYTEVYQMIENLLDNKNEFLEDLIEFLKDNEFLIRKRSKDV